MGRLEAYKGIIDYYTDANRMCKAFSSGCKECPLHVEYDEGGGCDKSIFSFSWNKEEGKEDIRRALYKMYVVGKWCDEHPEEADNDTV